MLGNSDYKFIAQLKVLYLRITFIQESRIHKAGFIAAELIMGVLEFLVI